MYIGREHVNDRAEYPTRQRTLGYLLKEAQEHLLYPSSPPPPAMRAVLTGSYNCSRPRPVFLE